MERDAELVRWRQGRSLPYGEGVTFWALAEIVKAEPGILENDTPEEGEDEAAPGGRAGRADPPSARGSSGTCGRSPASRRDSGGAEEGAAAWRRFLEALAEERPLVLVFEDLHWADDALLEFVDGLVERVERGATARPRHSAARSCCNGARAGVGASRTP